MAKRENGGGIAVLEGVAERDQTGRFIQTGRQNLTEMQTQFVRVYVRNGGNAKEAQAEAGYSPDPARRWELMNNPAVREAIRVEQSKAVAEGASVAWGVMRELMTDPVAPAPVRFQAAKWTLEASGHGLAAAALMLKAGDGQEKPLSEMSVAELEEHVARAGKAVEAMKSAQKVIECAPEQTSDSGGAG